MSDLVPADQIEHIVGAKRHATLHLARAVSSNQTVYILHSHQCLTDTRRFGRDLRDCPFSRALDEGIDVGRWTEDEPRGVVIEDGRLVPGEGTARESVQHDCAAMGHLYDDDWPWPDQVDMRTLAPGSRVGDPCIWCDHEKGADE